MGFKRLAQIALLSAVILMTAATPVFAQSFAELEECRDALREWRETCKLAENATSSECSIGKVCNKNGSNWRMEDAGTPYEIEFFDVTDPEGGLIAPGQIRPEESRFTNANGERYVLNVVYEGVSLLARMVSLFALLVMIAGIYFLITANGDDNQITKGKDAIKYSLLGVVFVLLSYTIVVFVQSIFF